MYLGRKWELMSTIEVTSETNVYACFTQPPLTKLASGNNRYLAVFLETIILRHSC